MKLCDSPYKMFVLGEKCIVAQFHLKRVSMSADNALKYQKSRTFQYFIENEHERELTSFFLHFFIQ